MQNIPVFLAKKRKIGGQYRIISKLGLTNECGVIKSKVPFSRDYLILFYKEDYVFAEAVIFREIDKFIWTPREKLRGKRKRKQALLQLGE